jgi:hypothetical protein
MNKNIAIINTAIQNSYDQQVLNLVNEILCVNKNIDANLYTTTINVGINNKKFGILPIYEAKYFYGKAIVWDPITLDLVYGFPNLSEIIYIHNNTIPWRENPNMSYKVWDRLFINKKLNLLISDKNIYEIFRLTWNTGTLIESIDSRTIYEAIQQNV